MTKEQFNSLPLEARSFIEKHAGCLACGNSASKLDKAYALYKNSVKMSTFQLFGGGVNFKNGEETGVLYNVRAEDTPFEIREKIRLAKAIHAKSPHLFSSYNEQAMDDLIASLTDEVVDLSDNYPETFDVRTASYDELKAFVKDNGIEAKSQSKKDLIEAIEGSLL